jgi:acyl-CoA synthetase (AMP-forming)/AMP-acid ligase II
MLSPSPSPRTTGSPEDRSASTFGDVLDGAAVRHPTRDALVFPNERISFDEPRRRVRSAARSLMALGLARRDAIGILMPNCVDNVVFFFASALAGTTCVPINSRF